MTNPLVPIRDLVLGMQRRPLVILGRCTWGFQISAQMVA